MTNRAWIVLLPFFAIALSYVLFSWASEDLEFRERSSPAGFRELVLGEPSANRSSVLALIPGSVGRPVGMERPDEPGRNFCSALYQDVAAPAVGPEDADVVLVEFLDYRCPYCRTLSGIIDEVQEKFRLRVIYKEWPILGASSRLASRAALAAHNQGRYLDFHKRLIRSRFVPTPAYIKDMVREFDMDLDRLTHDMDTEETTQALRRSFALANYFNLAGTPALIVGRTVVQGALSRKQLERLISIEASEKYLNPCFAEQ